MLTARGEAVAPVRSWAGGDTGEDTVADGTALEAPAVRLLFMPEQTSPATETHRGAALTRQVTVDNLPSVTQ
ncbi:hypothetical protein MDUV_01470 [Mycolicibacterium duvalii]|uniref:Uncharacterized protein n=1 Tax=Mycolicibacterium duvalii TaxID=39688 RepID=A0A7I7JTW0_9MYCO|nr:hypothetical protein MDUV_01470 [Mycolicibacterium duvalii]